MHAALSSEVSQSPPIRAEVAAQQPRLSEQLLNPLSPHVSARPKAIENRSHFAADPCFAVVAPPLDLAGLPNRIVRRRIRCLFTVRFDRRPGRTVPRCIRELGGPRWPPAWLTSISVGSRDLFLNLIGNVGHYDKCVP